MSETLTYAILGFGAGCLVAAFLMARKARSYFRAAHFLISEDIRQRTQAVGDVSREVVLRAVKDAD